MSTVTERADVVIIGGGIAGGALALGLTRAGLSVVLLEFQDGYKDLVRGEMLSPWGLQDAERLGVGDAVYGAGPAPLRRWVQWDEIYHPDDAPSIDLTQTFVPGVGSPHAIHHYKTCMAMVTGAQRAGATVQMAVKDFAITKGANPSVTYTVDGRTVTTRCRIVVGAGGRHGPVGRELGTRLERYSHHWGAGLAVEGMEDWPAGVQAMGTEGNRMFFVFPQKYGKARLYLNYPASDCRKYVGPNGPKNFLAAFELQCLPLRDIVVHATPTGPCMSSPSMQLWLTHDPFIEGVVLIGDEAGANDPVLGTGLSNAFRDARIVGELMLENRDWSPATFRPYADERSERLRKLNWGANLLGTLYAEFGSDATERRRRALERMRRNPNYMVTLMVTMSGPDRVPEFGFSDFLVERLLAEDNPRRARTPRLAVMAS
jgi:2-polyprenyl-6-methoxyphenol hydroxylase-like FAD-dependent oxidoreductase